MVQGGIWSSSENKSSQWVVAMVLPASLRLLKNLLSARNTLSNQVSIRAKSEDRVGLSTEYCKISSRN